MPPHPLTNFEIQKYYQNESRLIGVYSRYNLPNQKTDRVYVRNFYEYFNMGTHWIALCALNNNVASFGSFRVEYIPKEIKKSLLINL